MRYFSVLVLAAGLAGAADPPKHSIRSTMTNRDVVTLAKAGLDEDFLIRVINGARCQCETTSDAIAALAVQGVSQRVIEAVLDAAFKAVAGEEDAPKPAAAAPQPPKPAPTPLAMAVEGRVPFEQSSSMFWGLLQKRVAVAPASESKSSQAVGVTVNGAWQQVERP